MKEHRHLTPEQVTLLLDGTLSEAAIQIAAGLLIGSCAVCLEMIRRRVLGLDEPGIESRPEGPPARPRT